MAARAQRLIQRFPEPIIHFIADLHLAPETPGALAIFERFLAGEARHGSALYILGDLFDVWVGDDDRRSGQRVIAALRALTAAGVTVGLIPGNRDFLLGTRFAAASGVERLADPSRLELAEGPILLSHGDALCTADTDYQAFRRQTRDPAWQAAFLARPLTERRAIAHRLRADSERAKPAKSWASMDVEEAEVCALLRAQRAKRLIHGHTHRPGNHVLDIDGQRAERWVLGAWSEEQGDALRLQDGVLTRLTLA